MKPDKFLVFTLTVAALVFMGCPDPEHPKPDAMDSASPDGGTPCEKACANLERLGCPEAKPSKAGVTCPEVCVKAAETGLPLDPVCVSGALDESQVHACNVRCVHP